MINWNKPNKMPKEGSVVGVMIRHFKRNTHANCDIIFGEVFHSAAGDAWQINELDEKGRGCVSYYSDISPVTDDGIFAWFYSDEINLPEWMCEYPDWLKGE